MSSNNLFRIGGIAGILSIPLVFAAGAVPVLFVIVPLLLAVFHFALYRFFGDKSPSLNLSAVVIGVGGSIFLALVLFMNGADTLIGIGFAVAFILPPALFGLVAYQNGDAGFSRTLAIIGIVAGVFGILNAVVGAVGGGWTNPNPHPLVLPTYFVSVLAAVVWMIWSAIILFRKA